MTLKEKLMMRDFRVYIIESPSPSDLLLQRQEGHMLASILSLADVPSENLLPSNLETLIDVLRVIPKHAKQDLKRLPIIHISAHGNADGMSLTSGEIVTWNWLSKAIGIINKAINMEFAQGLSVCLSTCNGFEMYKRALLEEEPPCDIIIGANEPVSWPESAIAFATFYHLFRLGREPEYAVNAMKVASGCDKFALAEVEERHALYTRAKIEEAFWDGVLAGIEGYLRENPCF